MRSRPRTERSRGPRCLNDEGTDDLYLSVLNSMDFRLAGRVALGGYPSPRKTDFQVLVKLSRVGFYPQGSDKRFQLMFSSFSKLLGTIYVSRLGYPSPRKTGFQVLVRLS